jgi:hypothetical protein
MANLVRAQAKTLEKAPNGFLVSPDSPSAKRAGLLLVKVRALYNQPPLETEQLKVVAVAWAEELIKAGIPPRRWEEMATLARQFRPTASKAFMITCDQIIDCWNHYWLRDSTWSDGDWRAKHSDEQTKFCGECRRGYRMVKREMTRTNQWGVEESYDPPQFEDYPAGSCRCKIEYRARNSYFLKRFEAAYEIAYGREYEIAGEDLASLTDLSGVANYPLKWDRWDGALGEYFLTAKAPTLEEFCASEAFAEINEARRQEAARRQWQAERDAENQRKREEGQRLYQEQQRREERQKRERLASMFPGVYPKPEAEPKDQEAPF